MKKVYKRSLTSKLYMILGLCWIWMSMSSCLFNYYSPNSDVSFSGTSSFCLGATASATTYTYNQCTLGLGFINSGVTMSVQWYYNTTGGTVIATSTPLGAASFVTSSPGGTGTLTFTPLTSTVGTFYYFAYLSWGTTGTCTPDYTTNTTTITITAPAATISGPDSMCIGNTVTLTATAPGGVWSSSSPPTETVAGSGVTGVVTGLVAGTARISYTLAGCAATEIVTVLATPTTINPVAPVSVCQGATTTLTVTPAGGTWTSSAPGVATVSSSGVVSGMSGGSATITYKLGTGCYQTKNVTVIPVPGPIGGAFIACPGFNSLLTDPAAGGTWSSSTPGVGTIDPVTGMVRGITPGTTTITYTGCGFVTQLISVNALPPAVVGPGNVCAGGATIALSDPDPSPTSGTWSSAAPGIATAITAGSGLGIITGVTAGTATITYMASNSCFALDVVTVTPLPAAITGIIPLCVGQSATLANTVPGGLWYSSVPGIAAIDPFTGTVTGMVGGVSIVSYTTGCGTATAAVNIDELTTPITGTDSVCIGSFTTLADVTIGGSWSSSNPAVASVLPGSGLVTGNAVGTTYISYIMPGGCYQTNLVTSFLLPSTITGTAALCPGGTTTLSNSISGGTWTSTNPSGATIGASTGVVTGLSANEVEMIYTTPSGCTASAIVTVNPVPMPIIGEVNVCATDIDTLADLTPGGAWSSLTPSVGTIDPSTGVVTTLTGGTVVIKYTLPTGCYITKSFAVQTLPGPIVTFNSAINTFYTTAGYPSYQWYNSAQGLIPGATTYRTAGILNGYYYVVVTDTNGCKGKSANYNYDQSMSVGNTTAGNPEPAIYPNPSTEVVYIDCNVPVMAVISTIDGKKLIEQDNAKKIDISGLANGIYFVTVYDKEGTQLKVQKLVKQ